MGTSSSSSGPGAGVSFDPPWLNSLALEISSPESPMVENAGDDTLVVVPQTQNNEIAPMRRFSSARLQLGKYAQTGDRAALKKALGHYSRKGMGGASRVAGRMKVSTAVAGKLFELLHNVRDRTDGVVRDWVERLLSRSPSVYEIADEIINQIIPIGGSLEEESCKDSMAQAISEILVINPEITLVNMDDNNIWTVIEFFIANEAFNRLNLDIGQLFESSKYSPIESVIRMNDMKEYLKSEISVQIQSLRGQSPNPTRNEINTLLQSALKLTFEIFEEDNP